MFGQLLDDRTVLALMIFTLAVSAEIARDHFGQYW